MADWCCTDVQERCGRAMEAVEEIVVDVEAAVTPAADGAREVPAAGSAKMPVDSHPDAAMNVRESLKTAQPLSTIARGAALFVVLLLLSPLLLLFGLLMVLLAILYWTATKLLFWMATLENVRSNHEPGFLGRPEADVPVQLKGVFYQRNVSIGGDLMSFERGNWNAAKSVMEVSVYRPLTYSFREGFFAVFYLALAKMVRLSYVYHFKTEDGKLVDATISVKTCCMALPLSMFVRFGITDVSAEKDGSLWERWTVFCGVPLRSYWVERVLAAGEQTAYFPHLVAEVPAESIVIRKSA